MKEITTNGHQLINAGMSFALRPERTLCDDYTIHVFPSWFMYVIRLQIW